MDHYISGAKRTRFRKGDKVILPGFPRRGTVKYVIGSLPKWSGNIAVEFDGGTIIAAAHNFRSG
jgi:hypothetical protein